MPATKTKKGQHVAERDGHTAALLGGAVGTTVSILPPTVSKQHCSTVLLGQQSAFCLQQSASSTAGRCCWDNSQHSASNNQHSAFNSQHQVVQQE